MFSPQTYQQRRQRLCDELGGSGQVLLLGNDESPRNFPHNTYAFRQDSNFLYFFGLRLPGLAGLIDLDSGSASLFGDDSAPEDVVWTGELPPLAALAEQCGVTNTAAASQLAAALAGKSPLLLPDYRAETRERLSGLFAGDPPPPSTQLVAAVVAQRSYKSAEEIEQIEQALSVSHAVHTAAMRSMPGADGRFEYEIVGELIGIARSMGAENSFNTIFSKRGEILHNPNHHNQLSDGDLVVHDSGAETAMGYASDITRTLPVGGKFDTRQREIYSIVLESQQAAIDLLAPGVPFRDLHRASSRVLLEGLAGLGIVRGDIDEALAADTHTLFFPCGLGHMMGLDVHDMEAIGEDLVGYDDEIQRNPVFGWKSLRLGRRLQPDWVVTVEPGIYFNGLLADRWRAEGTCAEFIDHDAFAPFRDFGGVRLEDDFLITEDGYQLLGEEIPKQLAEVEAECARG